MFIRIIKFLKRAFSTQPNPSTSAALSSDEKNFLLNNVKFYQQLSQSEQIVFDQRVLLFLQTTNIIANDVSVTIEDKLLVAAGAIIPVWKFPNWHFFFLQAVVLVPSNFNNDFEYKKNDSNIEGMVVCNKNHATMYLSKPALHYGFSNNRDKRNVAIHEFAHLIDFADGYVDGLPDKLLGDAYCLPWLELVHEETLKIEENNSNIRDYAATHKAEFFAVASEYFFERPKLLKRKHPEVCQALEDFYQYDVSALQESITPRKKAPCPCGSGKRYKRCCLPKP